MKLGKLKLDIKEGIKREWIISNGIGGFASSTIIGANIRKYHGLLIAALNPPTNRYLILSKLDENVNIKGKNYPLFTNFCKTYISDGYKNLASFEKEYYPIYTYKIDDCIIEKSISMIYGKNATVISYNITTGTNPIDINISPIINYRNIHDLSKSCSFELKQKMNQTSTKVIVDNNKNHPIYMQISEGSYTPFENDLFKNMYYIREEERGYDAEENLPCAGMFNISIPANTNKIVYFVVSIDDKIDMDVASQNFENEKNRLDALIENTGLILKGNKLNRFQKEKNQVIKDLIITSDSFIVSRFKGNSGCNSDPAYKSIIAGYPWFADWGRDSLISLEGLCLVQNRFDDAKKILLNWVNTINSGLVANAYDDLNGKLHYNSVDASLLLFEATNRYLKYTQDYDFVKKEIYPKLIEIYNAYKAGISLERNNIFVDKDGLLFSGTSETQNTWMDAKINDYVVTPRNGKAVEINALWYNAIKTILELAKVYKDQKIISKLKLVPSRIKKQFIKSFYLPKEKYLYDVVGNNKLRPNQLFALSLTNPVIDPTSEICENIIDIVDKKLLLSHGLKTLARGDEDYIAEYEGGPLQRDMAYHQGPAWPWLLGLYFDALNNMIKIEKDKSKKKKLEDKRKRFIDDTYITYKKEIYNSEGVCTISELYNSKLPYKPGGTISQAWSVSEVLRIIMCH